MFGRKERKNPFKRGPLTDLEDLRDDCIGLFLDSKMTYQDIHAAGGPTPATISKWLHRETRFPRLDTIRAMLRAMGHDLVPSSREVAAQREEKTVEERLGLEASIDRDGRSGRVKMPPRSKIRKMAREIRRSRQRELG